MKAWSRALIGQWHPKIVLLMTVPFVLAFLAWAGVLFGVLQILIDHVHALLGGYHGYALAGPWLEFFGLLALKAFLAPLLAMWLLLPLVVCVALLLTGFVVMPVLVRHVGRRNFPQLELRAGGSVLGSLLRTLGLFVLFALLWLACLPLTMVPLLGVLIQPVLWGWLTFQVMSYDALALHASPEERRILTREKRIPMMVMGILAGLAGLLPGALWMLGGASLLTLPLLASLAVGLYVWIFVFTGLWFVHYCLDVLHLHRQAAVSVLEEDSWISD